MDLTEPLLESSENAVAERMTPSSDAWPTEAAERAKLYIPPSWPGAEDPDSTCIVTYDPSKKLICIVGDEGEVLDAIDPRDVIGCDLELKLFGPTESLSHVGFRNAKARARDDEEDNDDTHDNVGQPDVSPQDSHCDIFKPCAHDVEKIFSVDNHDEQIPFDTQATAILNIYCYPRKHPSQQTWGNWLGVTSFLPTPNPNPPDPVENMGPRYPHHRHFEVVRSEDFADIRSLVRSIRSVAQLGQCVDQEHAKRYLVLLNPVSGRKQGQSIYDTVVQPMLEQAGVDHDLLVTTHASHAEEYMAEVDVDKYDAFIPMGGDGMVHDVLQGVRSRSDSDAVLKKLKLGIIGSGTSNGLAKSILFESKEIYSPLESTFMICKGKTSPMDLSIYNTTTKSYLSFLTFTWAMVADIDIDSECIRCVGALRYDIWGAYLALRLRSYRARLSYLPPSEDDSKLEMPALADPVPSEWKTIEDDIVLLWAAQVSHASYSVYNSPPSHLQDGVFQILIIRRSKASRYEMAKCLLLLDSGGHANSSCCEFIECVAWRLEPITTGSYNDLDGEVVESGRIQGKVLPGAIQVFGDPAER